MRRLRRIWRALRRAAAQRIRGRKGTRVRCEGCHQWVGTAYLMPIPGEGGGIELRCEDCRRLWHQAITDYYAHRTADAAAARFDRERVGARCDVPGQGVMNAAPTTGGRDVGAQFIAPEREAA